MTNDNNMDVPLSLGLPRICPVCCRHAEHTLPVLASGFLVPFSWLLFRLTGLHQIPAHYCAEHFIKLRDARRQAMLIMLVAMILLYPSVLWEMYRSLHLLPVCLVVGTILFFIGWRRDVTSRSRSSQGVQIRTFLMRPFFQISAENLAWLKIVQDYVTTSKSSDSSTPEHTESENATRATTQLEDPY